MVRKKEREDFLEKFFPIEFRELPLAKHLRLDSFEREVLHNIHLELADGDGHYLLSPALAVLLPKEDREFEGGLKEEEEFLTQLKRYVIQDLVHHAAILEGNSYFIEQNYCLTIVRFIPAGQGTYEQRFYTNTRAELTTHYSDKIYLGRGEINLTEEKKQFGLPYLLGCVKREYERLRIDARERLRNPRRYHSTLMNEIEELVAEIASNTTDYLGLLPTECDDPKLPIEELNHLNSRNRSMKHLLVELCDSVSEFESLLRIHHENEFARYLTKFKKDIANLINLYNIKIIPSVTLRIRG
ncbi:MAG: hypothetical protein AB1714_15425 [Acidobacteriota bacterium]